MSLEDVHQDGPGRQDAADLASRGWDWRSSGRKWAQALVVPAAVVAIWAVAALQWRLGDLVVPWDSKNQFYAFYRFMAEAIEAGQSPFWNPFHYAGHPSIADPQSLVLAPAFVLWALIDPHVSLKTFDLLVFSHLLAGGLAVAEYGRRHQWVAPARILAAAVFMLGGSASARLNHVGIIIAFGLFPVAYLLLERMLIRRSALAAILFGSVCAFIALGRTQVPLLLCALLATLALYHGLRRGPVPLRQRWTLLALSAATALVILCVPLLLTLQFAQVSNRPDIDIAEALRSSLHPLNWANFFVPDVFGSLDLLQEDWGPGYGRQPLLDATDRSFNYLFCGSLPALLLIWQGLVGGRAWERRGRIFGAICLAAMIYALGRFTPAFAWLFHHVPGLSLFRRPVDALFLFGLGLAYLSGHLATAYVRRGPPRCPTRAVVVSLAAVLALAAGAVAYAAQVSKGRETAAQIALALPIYIGLFLLLWRAGGRRARLLAMSVAVLLTSGELVLRNAASRLNAEPSAAYALLEKPDAQTKAILETIRADQRRLGGDARRTRTEIVGLGGAWQNAAMVYGLEVTNGYNPLRIGTVDRLVSPGESPYTVLHRQFTSSFPDYNCLLGRLLGLQYVVLDRPIEQMATLDKRAGAVPLMQGPDVWIYRLPGAVPRATLEDTVDVEDTDQYVVAGLFPSAMPPSEVMVDTDLPLTQHYLKSAFPRSGTARIVSWSLNRVVVDVDTPRASILSLHDPWYPGWEVRVDGIERPLLKTNVMFRGVEIPDGTHRVEFDYRPLSLANLWHAARGLFGHED